MKSRAILPALLAAGLFYLASASSAHAFELLDRVLNVRSHGAGCCAAEVGCGAEIGCAAPAPSCDCAPAADCCQPRCRHGLLDHLFNCCKPQRGCDAAACCQPEPACCAPEPACGAPVDCCKPRRGHGLLHKLFHHCHRSKCGCDAGCDIGCGAELSCGCQ